MIVNSLVDGKNYFWVKVPRTATHSYEKLFFSEFTDTKTKLIHLHTPYYRYKQAQCKNKPEVVGGFGVVRNPYERFVSSLRYLRWKHNKPTDIKDEYELLHICEFCGERTLVDKGMFFNRNFIDFLQNETIFYDFIYSSFDKNCMLKSGLVWEETFQAETSSIVFSMFKTQTFFVYHPEVKIFRYENLQEFNTWIENTLRYSTKSINKINSSKHIDLNIDTTTKKFKELVKYLFHDDFKLFGYNI